LLATAVMLACSTPSLAFTLLEGSVVASAINDVDRNLGQDSSSTSAPVANFLSLAAGTLFSSARLVASDGQWSVSGTAQGVGGDLRPDRDSVRSDGRGQIQAVLGSFSLDPQQAGVMAEMTFSMASSHITANTARRVDDEYGRTSVSLVLSQGDDVLMAEFSQSNPLIADELSLTHGPSFESVVADTAFSGSYRVRAGAMLTAPFSTAVHAGSPDDSRFRTTTTGSGTFSYALRLIEDRRHWAPSGAGGLSDGVSWIELAAPDAGAWAVFNQGSPRNLTLALDGSRTWRGLIVDGEQLALDMNGHTLTLGIQGASRKTASLLLGEGRDGVSALILRNGTVLAALDVMVGAAGGAGGALVLDNGTQLLLNGANVTGVRVANGSAGADSHLQVLGGSLLRTPVLVLGSDTGPASGSLAVSGTGSMVDAQLVRVSGRAAGGHGEVSISEGGQLRTESLVLGEHAGTRGKVTVSGAGSGLAVYGGALVAVGASARGGTGTLEVLRGALLDGEAAVSIKVGNGDLTQSSTLRVADAGTQMRNAGVKVLGGGNFFLRDGATWSEGNNLLLVTGGRAEIEAATAELSSLQVERQVRADGGTQATGQVTLSRGGTLRVNNTPANDVFVGMDSFLTLTDTGTRLTVAERIDVAGTLAVNNDARLVATDIAVLPGGRLQGHLGHITGNIFVQNGGIVAPGQSPGTLTIEGDLQLADGALLVLEIAGYDAGIQHDQLIVTGHLKATAANVQLSFLDGFAPRAGDHFDLLQVAGGMALGENTRFTFSGLAAGWQFEVQLDGTGQSLSLLSLNDGIALAVPEPETYALMLAGLGLVGFAVRRRA
jgi:hypothetical protein